MLKKILNIVYIILFIILIYIFQVFVIDSRDLFGVKPNLILITVVAVSLWYGLYTGTIFAFVIGLITDMVFGNNIGLFTIAYTFTGIFTGLINDKYRKENKMSLVYVTLISTAVFEIVQYIQYLFLTHTYSNFLYFLKQIALTSILNTIIVFIIYGIIYKIIEYFDSELRRNQAI